MAAETPWRRDLDANQRRHIDSVLAPPAASNRFDSFHWPPISTGCAPGGMTEVGGRLDAVAFVAQALPVLLDIGATVHQCSDVVDLSRCGDDALGHAVHAEGIGA